MQLIQFPTPEKLFSESLLKNPDLPFSSPYFKEWNAGRSSIPYRSYGSVKAARFEDWYRLQNELDWESNEDVDVQALHFLWISSFRFEESGYLDGECERLLGKVSSLLAQYRLLLRRQGVLQDERWSSVLVHLTQFSHTVRSLRQLKAGSRILNRTTQFEGSVWDIVMEELTQDLIPSQAPSLYLRQEHGLFQLQVTPTGFITQDGFEGLWTWTLFPGGRLSLEIGGDYPMGWGWYTQQRQAQINVYFYRNSSPRAVERMRWTRRSAFRFR